MWSPSEQVRLIGPFGNMLVPLQVLTYPQDSFQEYRLDRFFSYSVWIVIPLSYIVDG